MGVSYSAKIVVGLPFNQIPNAQELLDDCRLDSFSYYYDCDEEDRLIGYEIQSSGSYNYSEIPVVLDNLRLSKRFHEETGLHAKVYLTLDGY